MYQALYRKWRPRDFSDVVGQEHITETLRQQVASGRLSHAYLFVGTRGTGKTTCAKILAKAANCEHPVDGNPCNQCPSCLGIENGSILDVEELDAASNNGVDNIRVIRDEAIFSPATVRRRVYIIDEVHMLSVSAFNALLKILEEPPEHLIFILATTEIHKVPATILSRCQRYSFKRITARDICHRMEYIAEREGITLTKEAAEILSRLADGAMRDGLSLLDQCIWDNPIDADRVMSAIGLAGSENTANMFRYVINGQVGDALSLLSSLYMDGKDPGSVLEELCDLCRDMLIMKVAPNGGEGLLSGAYSQDILKMGEKLPSQRLLYIVKTIQTALDDIDRAADRKISAELCLMQLCDERLSDDIAAISARVSKLEAGGVVMAAPVTTPAAAAPAAPKPAPEMPKPAVKAPPTPPIEDRPPWDDEPPAPPVHRPAPAPARPVVSFAEPEPAPAAPIPASTPAPAEAAPVSGNVWKDILAAAEKEIDIAPFSFLSDKAHAEGEITGNTLYVGAKNIIAKSMIEAEPVVAALRKAAEQVLGHPVVVKVGEFKPKPVNTADKLAALRKFDNIKFE